jgi:glycosyltransferase A (GT-A) superfamily protein (DUF2064 family)
VSDEALAVLMRWPRRGQGKSRLAAGVGVDAAHRLHRAFVADTLAWTWSGPRVLAVSPDAAAVLAARAAAPHASVVAQPARGLGERIAGGLDAALRTGASCAVLVGTDSPSLPHSLLLACVGAAVRYGAAMVPAEDGGFVALAVRRDAWLRDGLAWLRGGIAWSTEHTAAQARAAGRRCGLSVATTEPWYDVDTAADLDRLFADLVCTPHRAPRTLGCLDALGAGRVAERAS